ncbi:MAG TPA: type II secretion system F family protein [Acetobacteraceae bacterium]|nr:type II secretion system F family protein [Acetobacteraceae bacterium]
MSAESILGLLGAAALPLFGSAIALIAMTARHRRLRMRVQMVQASAGLTHDAAPGYGEGSDRNAGNGALRLVALVGTAIARSGLLSTRTITEFEQTLLAAGFRGGNGLGLFVGGKLLLLASAPIMTLSLVAALPVSDLLRNVFVFGSAALGLLTPDVIVQQMRSRYLRTLERGVPDALDMLVICAEAGLGLEAAISRVGAEIRPANRAVSAELAETASELRITSDMRAALLNLGRRTGLESLKRLGAVLTQSIQYGTPLTRALRTISAEMREQMLIRFEARAARLPVLLTVPMIIFILPCVFMIVGGPAVLQVLHAFHH